MQKLEPSSIAAPAGLRIPKQLESFDGLPSVKDNLHKSVRYNPAKIGLMIQEHNSKAMKKHVNQLQPWKLQRLPAKNQQEIMNANTKKMLNSLEVEGMRKRVRQLNRSMFNPPTDMKSY